MKRCLPILALLCLSLNPGNAQTIFQENFETDFETNGWATDPVWTIGTASELSSPSFTVPIHSKMAGVNDDGPGDGVPSFGRIITPDIDLTGSTLYLLRFEAYFINGDYNAVDETARVLITTDSMATWSTLFEISGSNTWQSILIPMGNGVAGHHVQLAFEYDDNDGWNFGLCLDNIKVEVATEHAAQVVLQSNLPYTVSTQKQLTEPLRFVHQITNLGTQPLEGVVLKNRVTVTGVGVVAIDSHAVATIPSGAAIWDTIAYWPTTLGKHNFTLTASNPELGPDFYTKTLPSAFALSDSTLAKDDGERDISIGMSFGDPNWYGYYGSEFDLAVADTLTGISVWMTVGTAPGSFNLLVNVKDATGSPNIEFFHSNPMEIAANYSGWFYFPMPSAIPMAAGNYIFAVGQDTIQGVMGHGFDEDRPNPGYWIVSPVAGGGYPWASFPGGQTLMIRPHMKVQPFISSLSEPAAPQLKVFPNPAHGYVEFDFGSETGEFYQVRLTNTAGQVVLADTTRRRQLDLSRLPSGIYFLHVQHGNQAKVVKLMKQ